MNFDLFLSVFAIPLCVWFLSYLLLVREFRTWKLRRVKIHETGRQTLLGTVFYFNHFLRELPIDTLYALAIFTSLSALGVGLGANGRPFSAIGPWTLLVIFLAASVAGSVIKVGGRATLLDFGQFRERDDLVGWGSHWRMHFLSTCAIILMLALPGFWAQKRIGEPQALILLGVGFVGLSALFKTDGRALSHPRWMLHGAREIFTFFFLAALPAYFPLVLAGRIGIFPVSWPALAALAVFLMIVLQIVRVSRKADVTREAQSDRGLIYLLSSHFFEHVLDVVYIFLVVVCLLSKGSR